jgi:hypothetical protein
MLVLKISVIYLIFEPCVAYPLLALCWRLIIRVHVGVGNARWKVGKVIHSSGELERHLRMASSPRLEHNAALIRNRNITNATTAPAIIVQNFQSISVLDLKGLDDAV